VNDVKPAIALPPLPLSLSQEPTEVVWFFGVGVTLSWQIVDAKGQWQVKQLAGTAFNREDSIGAVSLDVSF